MSLKITAPIVVLGLLALLVSWSKLLSDNRQEISIIQMDSIPIIKVNNIAISVELADTPKKQAMGLSGRETMAENRGMLFLYDKAGFYGFWMEDMRFPIDIIWFDEERKIINITKNIPPESFPDLFGPSSPARYVLELNAGFADRNNIKVGDEADFSELK